MAAIFGMAAESFGEALKKESLSFGAVYIILSVLLMGLVLGIFVFGTAMIAVLRLVIQNELVGIILLYAALVVFALIVLALSAALNVFLYTGYKQIILEGKYDFAKIWTAIMERGLQTVITTMLLALIFIVLFGLVVFVPFVLLKHIGAIAGMLAFFVLALVLMPLFMLLTPETVLGEGGPIKSVANSAKLGVKNYPAIAIAMIIIAALGTVIGVVQFLLVPIIIVGWAIIALISILYNAFCAILLIRLREELAAKTGAHAANQA